MTFFLVILLLLVGWIRFKTLFNLLTWIIVVFSLHNLVYFWLNNIGVPIRWIAPTDLSRYLLDDVHTRNIRDLLVTALVVLIVYRERKVAIRLPNVNIMRLIYIVMVIPSITYYLAYEGIEYGAGQSLDSTGSFSPLKRIVDFRYFILIYIIIGSRRLSKALIILILVELSLGFISGARKPFTLVLGTAAYMLLFNSRVSVKKLVVPTCGVFLSTWILLFINITRSLEAGLVDRLYYFFYVVSDYGSLVLAKLFISMSSEGVQVWSAQLINAGTLKISNGLTILQALLNIVVLRPLQGSLSDYQAAYLFKSVAYPGVDNQGWDYTFAAETYLNFGEFGFMFYAVFFYIVCRGRQSRKPLMQLLSVFTIIGIIVYFRTDMTSFFRAISYMFVIYYLGIFVSKFNKNDKNIT